MRPIRIAGLTLVLAAAVVPAITGTASAALPEFGKCVAAEGKTGQYKGSQCTQTSAAGGFNWAPEPTGAAKFSGAGEGIALQTVAGHKVACAGANLEGAYTGPKTETVTLTMIGCEVGGLGQACESNPLKPGEIESQLEGEIGYIKNVEKQIVGLDLKPKSPSTTFAAFQCGKPPEVGPSAVIEGSAIAPIRPINRMSEEFKIAYKESAGKQAVQRFEGGATDTLTAKWVSGVEVTTEEAALKMLATDTNEELTELRTRP